MGQRTVGPLRTRTSPPRRAVKMLRGLFRINLGLILALLVETQWPMPFWLFLYLWGLGSWLLLLVLWPPARFRTMRPAPSPVLSFQNVETELIARRHEHWREGGQPTNVVPGSAAYWAPPDPRTPAWLVTPYAGRDACWGCGLEPEVMNPGQWILCFWCNELRAAMPPQTSNPPMAPRR